MVAVTDTWNDPTGATLDVAVGDTGTETYADAVSGDLLYLYRRRVIELTNKSGGQVIKGDVVILDTANTGAFTTTATANSPLVLGVAAETIANAATGKIATLGASNTTGAVQVLVDAACGIGDYLATTTTAKKAKRSATDIPGSFAIALAATGGAGLVDALLLGPPVSGLALTGTTLASAITASSLTSVGTLTSLTVSGFSDITAGGLRVKGAGTAPGADASTVNAILVLSAGSGGTPQANIDYFAGASRLGLEGFTNDTGTIGGVAMAKEDFKWYLNKGGTPGFVGFIDDSNSGQLVWGAGGIRTPAAFIDTGDLRINANATGNAIANGSQGASSTTLYIGNASINVTSDRRLKRNITDTVIDAVALLDQFPVRDYDPNDPTDRNNPWGRAGRGRWYGQLVAQDIVDLVPWLINAEDRSCPTCRAGRVCIYHGSPWGLDLPYLAGLYARAIQQLNARLEAIGG